MELIFLYKIIVTFWMFIQLEVNIEPKINIIV